MENKIAVSEIGTLTTEILILKQQTAQNLIEIGKRLVIVKDNLPHGEWGKWLKEKVDFTDRTAQRFMKVANEFSNTTALSDLPKSKVFALLDLPGEEREEFVKSNPVSEMSTRELQEAIKAQKKAEKRAADAEKKASALEKSLEAEKHSAKVEVDQLNALLEEAKNNGSSEEQVKQLETELQNAKNQVQELTNKINEPITIEPVVIEKIPEEIELELAELRGKLEAIKIQPASNPAILKYSIHFESVVNGFKNLLGALAEIAETDTEAHEKYKHTVSGLLGKMTERL